MRRYRLTMALLAVIAVAVLAWLGIGHRQVPAALVTTETLWEEAEPPALDGLSQKDIRAVIEPYFVQAKQAQESSQWDLAAARFIDLAARLPDGSLRLKMLFAAADCFVGQGQTYEAVEVYAEAIAIGTRLLSPNYDGVGDAEHGPLALPKMVRRNVKDYLARLLSEKVLACYQVGDLQSALQTVRRLQVWFPGLNNWEKVLPILAEIEGYDSAQLLAYEQAASALCAQAFERKAAGQHDEGYPLVDAILNQYPYSAAVPRALSIEGAMLWRDGQYDSAQVVYQAVLDRLQQVAPNCPLVREASSRIAWLESSRLIKQLHRRSRLKEQVEDIEWEQVRTYCKTVMTNDANPVWRAVMNVQLIETYHWQHQDDQVLNEVQKFLTLYPNTPATIQDAELKRKVMWAHFFAGASLASLGRHAEAVEEYQLIVDGYQDDPNGWRPGTPISDSYFGLWQSLRQIGAAPERIEAAAEPILSILPGSYYAQTILNADR